MLHDVEQRARSTDRSVFFSNVSKWVSAISFGADVSSSDCSWTRLDIFLCWLLFQLEKWPIAELPIWQWIFSSSSQMENEGDMHSSSSLRASEKLGFACFSPFYITVSWTPSEYLIVGFLCRAMGSQIFCQSLISFYSLHMRDLGISVHILAFFTILKRVGPSCKKLTSLKLLQ